LSLFNQPFRSDFLTHHEYSWLSSGKTKVTKNANESEYRAILDNLIGDLLVVLNWPEWPAANLMMGIVCKFMVHFLSPPPDFRLYCGLIILWN